MKKLLSLMMLTALFANCKRVREQTNINFDVTFHSIVPVPEQATINGGQPLPPGGVTVSYPRVPLATHINEHLDEYHAKADKLTKVNLRMASIDVVPTTNTFNYLDKIRIFISARDLPEQFIAYQYNIPKGTFRLNLQAVEDVNLKSYLLQDTVYLRVETHMNSVPNIGEQYDLSTTFYIEAKPFL